MQTIVKYIAVIHRILKILHTLFQSIELMKRVYKENTLASRIEFVRGVSFKSIMYLIELKS